MCWAFNGGRPKGQLKLCNQLERGGGRIGTPTATCSYPSVFRLQSARTRTSSDTSREHLLETISTERDLKTAMTLVEMKCSEMEMIAASWQLVAFILAANATMSRSGKGFCVLVSDIHPYRQTEADKQKNLIPAITQLQTYTKAWAKLQTHIHTHRQPDTKRDTETYKPKNHQRPTNRKTINMVIQSIRHMHQHIQRHTQRHRQTYRKTQLNAYTKTYREGTQRCIQRHSEEHAKTYRETHTQSHTESNQCTCTEAHSHTSTASQAQAQATPVLHSSSRRDEGQKQNKIPLPAAVDCNTSPAITPVDPITTDRRRPLAGINHPQTRRTGGGQLPRKSPTWQGRSPRSPCKN